MIPLDGLARVVMTILVGYAGAQIAFRLKIPAGQLLGPVIAVGTLQLVGAPLAKLDAEYRYMGQVLIGATVATTLTPSTVAMMVRLAGPASLAVVTMIVLGVLGGWVLHLVTGLPQATALFAGAPGGVVEMALAAGDLGGEIELVAALQIVRLISCIVVIPLLLRWMFPTAPVDGSLAGDQWKPTAGSSGSGAEIQPEGGPPDEIVGQDRPAEGNR